MLNVQRSRVPPTPSPHCISAAATTRPLVGRGASSHHHSTLTDTQRGRNRAIHPGTWNDYCLVQQKQTNIIIKLAILFTEEKDANILPSDMFYTKQIASEVLWDGSRPICCPWHALRRAEWFYSLSPASISK